jgi:polar amino acid transport system substrate-binding protein
MARRCRWLCWVALSLVAVICVACGEDGFFTQATPTVQLTVSTPSAIPLPPEASTAARIRSRGHMVVGVRYDDEPFGFVDEQGNLVGFDVDLAREFASRWLGDRNAVQFAQVTNDTVVERVETGQVDLVIGTLTPNQSDARRIAYSAPYYYDGLTLVVRSSNSVTDTVAINGPTDLDGAVVGVVEEADTEAPLLRAASAAVPQVVYYANYYAAMAGLDSGVLAAVVGPRRTLERLAADRSGVALLPRFTRNAYAIGVPTEDGPLRDLVNVTLMDIFSDGTYQRLFQQWLPNESPPDLEIWTGTSRLSFSDLGDTMAPAPSTIQEIASRGYLLVGLVDDHLPFGDFDASAVGRGFEAELARVFAGRWLGDVAAVQFVRHSEESGIAALKAGQIDLLAAQLPHTQPREDDIDFSQTIYQGGIGLLVNATSEIASFADLRGGTVAVPREGFTGDVVQKASARADVPVAVVTVSSVDEALAGVAEGRYDAYASWRVDLLELAYANPGFLVLDDRLTSRPLALGLRQNDSAFRDLVNFTLQEFVAENGFVALYDDWFGTDPPYGVDIWPGVPYRPLQIDRVPAAVPTPTP